MDYTLKSPLKSVMFWPGHHRLLFVGSKYAVSDQLDGVLELLQICNSYVLNDVTAVGGHSVEEDDRDEFSVFVSQEAEGGEAIQTIGHGGVHPLDLTPFEYELRMAEVIRRTREAQKRDSQGPESLRLAEASRILQAQTYILLADREDAVYIPERMYGYKALENYSNIARISTHPIEERFRTAIAEKLSDYYRGRPAASISIPCFLAEVLRNSSTRAGIPTALRQLRDSHAARNYRELARAMAAPDTSFKDWSKVGRELQALSDSAFRKEGMKTSVSEGLKVTAGLSAAAVGTLFPQLAIASAAKLVPGGFAALEYLDKWIRKRTNLFEIYAETATIDLHAEIKRLFPNVGFQAPQLQHFLENKNFGWPNQEEFLRFLAS